MSTEDTDIETTVPEIVLDAVATQAGLDETQIDIGMSLGADLGFDSDDITEIEMEIEEEVNRLFTQFNNIDFALPRMLEPRSCSSVLFHRHHLRKAPSSRERSITEQTTIGELLQFVHDAVEDALITE